VTWFSESSDEEKLWLKVLEFVEESAIYLSSLDVVLIKGHFKYVDMLV
jgi:hypothetical protein